MDCLLFHDRNNTSHIRSTQYLFFFLPPARQFPKENELNSNICFCLGSLAPFFMHAQEVQLPNQ